MPCSLAIRAKTPECGHFLGPGDKQLREHGDMALTILNIGFLPRLLPCFCCIRTLRAERRCKIWLQASRSGTPPVVEAILPSSRRGSLGPLPLPPGRIQSGESQLLQVEALHFSRHFLVLDLDSELTMVMMLLWMGHVGWQKKISRLEKQGRRMSENLARGVLLTTGTIDCRHECDVARDRMGTG